MPRPQSKAGATKVILGTTHSGESWTVKHGRLKPRPGRPRATQALFKAVAEKIPFDAMPAVKRQLAKEGIAPVGIYVAHDSMGVARYIGRGAIFHRLAARRRAQILELTYFSFYVGFNKTHEREIETLLIRAVGPQLYFNTKKKREDIQAGNVRDYEAGTRFFERQYRKGRKRNARRKS